MTITKCLCAVRLGHTFRLERYLVDLVSFASVIVAMGTHVPRRDVIHSAMPVSC
jgi:hypothetical protein